MWYNYYITLLYKLKFKKNILINILYLGNKYNKETMKDFKKTLKKIKNINIIKNIKNINLIE